MATVSSINKNTQYDALINRIATQQGVDPLLIKAMIGTESTFNPNAKSPKNAQGLMQLIPATAARFGVTNVYDPEQNITGGVKYVKWLLDRYHGDVSKTLAGYNAGEGAVDKYGGIPPYKETTNYVSQIGANYAALTGGKGIGYAQAVSDSGTVAGSGAQATAGADSQSQAAALYGQAAAAQTAGASQVQKLITGLPDTVSATQQSVAASTAALQSFSAESAAAIDTQLNELAANDAGRRAILQSLLTDSNYDPTVQGSVADRTANNLSMIERRLNATLLAEQAVQDATISNNPAQFVSRILFGNPYTSGRAALTDQSNSLATVGKNTLSTITSQAKVAGDAKFGDPAIINAQLQGNLKKAEIGKDVAIAQAEAPLKIINAQNEQIKNVAQLMGYQVQLQTGAADASSKQAAVLQDQADAPFRQRQLEAQAKSAEANAVISGLNADQSQRFYQAESDLKALQLQNGTAEQQSQAIIAQQKLSAVKKAAEAGAFDEAAYYEALAAASRTKQEYGALQIADKAGTAANKATAEAAQAASAVKLAGLVELTTQQEFQIKANEYAKTLGEQQALKAGASVLGAVTTPPAEKLTSNQRAGIAAVGAGQPAGSNPVMAAKVLADTGLADSPKYPGLSSTIAAIGSITTTDEGGNATQYGALSEEQLANIPKQEILDKITQRYNVLDINAPLFNAKASVYGMAPPLPDVINRLPQEFQQVMSEVASKPENLYSADTFINAVSTAIPDAKKAANAVAQYALASSDYNNSVKGYELLGLPKQDSIKVANPRLLAGIVGKKEYDLTVPADVSHLIMLVRTSHSITDVTKYVTNPFSAVYNDPTQ